MQLAFSYLFGFFFGVTVGLLCPTLVSWMLFFLGLFVIILVTEIIGYLRLEAEWAEYRFPLYVMYSTPFVLILVGVLFGGGKIGALLVSIGTLLSR